MIEKIECIENEYKTWTLTIYTKINNQTYVFTDHIRKEWFEDFKENCKKEGIKLNIYKW